MLVLQKRGTAVKIQLSSQQDSFTDSSYLLALAFFFSLGLAECKQTNMNFRQSFS